MTDSEHRRRTQFTEEDEEHLCSWIATKIPYKETGGRTGNRLYQQLCDLVCFFVYFLRIVVTLLQSADPEYAWASRHTWQSWRERYKKNATRLDALIALIVEEKKPVQGEKGQYGYVRQAEEKPKRSRKKRAKNMEHPPADVDQYAAVEGLVGLPAIPMPGLVLMGDRRAQIPELSDSHNVTRMFSKLAPTSAPQDHTAVRKSPAEEEMDEEEGEWMVRVGDAQPPAWGKRKVSEEAEDRNGNKRAKRRCVYDGFNMTVKIHFFPVILAPHRSNR